jgi:predicted lipid-binding transport protein (Tim44 family)
MIMGDGFSFDILFLGLVAAFLILRLRKVLGRRNGHEKPPPDIFGRNIADEEGSNGNITQLPENERPPADHVDSLRNGAANDTADNAADDATQKETPPQTDDDVTLAGLKDIQSVDEDFSADDFIQGASAAFEMIIEAFPAADKSTLRALLSDDVYDDFMSAIKIREESGATLENSLVGLKKAEILEAGLDGRTATLTIKLTSDQVSVTRDAEGEVVNGDPEHIARMVDIWTFSRNLRSRDPNWTLVETRSQN